MKGARHHLLVMKTSKKVSSEDCDSYCQHAQRWLMRTKPGLRMNLQEDLIVICKQGCFTPVPTHQMFLAINGKSLTRRGH